MKNKAIYKSDREKLSISESPSKKIVQYSMITDSKRFKAVFECPDMPDSDIGFYNVCIDTSSKHLICIETGEHTVMTLHVISKDLVDYIIKHDLFMQVKPGKYGSYEQVF